jgi:hypothetical protein
MEDRIKIEVFSSGSHKESRELWQLQKSDRSEDVVLLKNILSTYIKVKADV